MVAILKLPQFEGEEVSDDQAAAKGPKTKSLQMMIIASQVSFSFLLQ
jgi:hypothetical protein